MQLSELDQRAFEILDNMQYCSSLTEACKASKINPSTGGKLIKNIEKFYNVELISSTPFEGSELTTKGRILLRRYRKVLRVIERMNKPI